MSFIINKQKIFEMEYNEIFNKLPNVGIPIQYCIKVVVSVIMFSDKYMDEFSSNLYLYPYKATCNYCYKNSINFYL